MHNIWSFLYLIRILNLLIIVLTQYFIRIFIIGPPENWQQILLSPSIGLISLSTVLIAAAGYIINDYYDIKIDVINKPDRVIIDRKINRKTAILLQVILNAIGIGLGFLLSYKLVILFSFCAALLWFYSNYLKRQPLFGNITVSFLTAFSVLVLALYYDRNTDVIYAFSIFAFFISMIREIIKDMEDMKGDQRFDCRTLPIVIGIRKTKKVLYLIFSLFMLSGLVTALIWQGAAFWYFTLFLLPLNVYLLLSLRRADTREHFSRLSTVCKIIMIVGVISMVFI